jgi:hypothetical protein
MSRSVAGEFATVVAVAVLALIAQPAADTQSLCDAFRASRSASSALHAGLAE